MLKSKNTIITIIVLVLILFALIFGFSKFNFNNSLNVSGDGNTPPDINNPLPEFKYLPAIPSVHSNGIYENNFGGTNDDEVKMTYKLDYYYIIGNTTSKDNYFNKNKVEENLFVIKTGENGSAMHISLSPTCVTYVGSILHQNSIYILANSYSDNNFNSVFLEYSLLTNNFNILLTLKNQVPLAITRNDNIEILTSQNNKLCLTTYQVYNSATFTTPTNFSNGNIKLVAPYKNGILCFVNDNENFNMYYISTSSSEILNCYLNTKIISFTNTSYGYLTLIKNNSGYFYYLFDYGFNLLEEVVAKNANLQSKLLLMNDLVYCVSNINMRIVITLICNHADEILSNTLKFTITNLFFSTVQENNLIIAYETLEKNICVAYFDKLGNALKQILLPSNEKNKPKFIEKTYDNQLLLFGNSVAGDVLINRNFGKSDIYMLKINSSVL